MSNICAQSVNIKHGELRGLQNHEEGKNAVYSADIYDTTGSVQIDAKTWINLQNQFINDEFINKKLEKNESPRRE